jgi:hypothetical protein
MQVCSMDSFEVEDYGTSNKTYPEGPANAFDVDDEFGTSTSSSSSFGRLIKR